MLETMSSRLGGRSVSELRLDAFTHARHTARRLLRRPSPRATAAMAGGVLAVALAASALWWAPFLRVDDVRLQGATDATGVRILDAAGISSGEPLVEVDPDEVADRVRATGLVAGVHVDRRWPATVTVTVSPRVPVLAVATSPSQVELVDVDGVAFDRVAARGVGVPVATLGRRDAGSRPAQLRTAAAVVRSLSADQRKELTSLAIAASGIVSLRVGQVDVVWGDAGQGALKSAVLSSLLARPGVDRVDVSAPSTPALHERAATDRGVDARP